MSLHKNRSSRPILSGTGGTGGSSLEHGFLVQAMLHTDAHSFNLQSVPAWIVCVAALANKTGSSGRVCLCAQQESISPQALAPDNQLGGVDASSAFPMKNLTWRTPQQSSAKSSFTRND